MADMNEMQGTIPTPAARQKVINIEQLRKAQGDLEKYKSGKQNLDLKLIDNEDWWKLNHGRDFRHVKYVRKYDEETQTYKITALTDHPIITRQSAFLFNAIMNKHADMMDNFPDPVILAREEGDKAAAKTLSDIVPVILDNCDYEQVYSDGMWDKLINGGVIFGVFWNSDLMNGLGDIEVKTVDMLNFYWEPGVTDLQDSQNIFVLSLVDNKVLESMYPETRGNLTGNGTFEKRYNYDDDVDTSDKSIVVDWYYKVTLESGKTLLQYVKYVNDIILYSSEDDENHPEYKDRGYYDHSMFPFVLDPLFPEKGTPTGYGFVDVMRSAQEQIDELSNDFMENARWGAKPRYFSKDENGINQLEFQNLNQQIVHVAGNLDEYHVRPIDAKSLDGNYLNFYQAKIDELKEVSGNRDFSQGSTSSGVTSGSAIAALIETGSKGSRDIIKGTYRAFSQVCTLVIELIRQFYDTPRTFRIVGADGQEEFVPFNGVDIQGGTTEVMGQTFKTAEPVFDIKVKAQKSNPFSRLAQNELALQFYNLGFFNPQLSDQALATIDMMDFEGKESVIERITRNGTMFEQMQQMQQTMQQMAQLIAETTGDTRIADALMAQQGGAVDPSVSPQQASPKDNMGEPVVGNSQADKMRRRVDRSTEV